MQIHTSVLYLTEIKYLIDQIQQHAHILANQLQHPTGLSFDRSITQQLLHRVGNECQRCPEIMRDIGKKDQLGMSRRFQLMRQLFQLVFLLL